MLVILKPLRTSNISLSYSLVYGKWLSMNLQILRETCQYLFRDFWNTLYIYNTDVIWNINYPCYPRLRPLCSFIIALYFCSEFWNYLLDRRISGNGYSNHDFIYPEASTECFLTAWCACGNKFHCPFLIEQNGLGVFIDSRFAITFPWQIIAFPDTLGFVKAKLFAHILFPISTFKTSSSFFSFIINFVKISYFRVLPSSLLSMSHRNLLPSTILMPLASPT